MNTTKINPRNVTHKNGIVSYHYDATSRKWVFVIPAMAKREEYTLLASIRGVNQAHKVGSLVLGAARRAGRVDGLARHHINQVLNVKTYQGLNSSFAR